MAKLIVNVWSRGQGYGPGFGDRQPPPDLAARLPGRVWSDDTVTGGGGAGGGQASPVDPPPVAADDDGPVDDLAGLDKAALLDVAAAEAVDVDRRLGAPRLRERIRTSRRETGSMGS